LSIQPVLPVINFNSAIIDGIFRQEKSWLCDSISGYVKEFLRQN
tara:strand:- start:41 stop:172 length:132 start_codon:yes stop_codon:yes gene_type:complete